MGRGKALRGRQRRKKDLTHPSMRWLCNSTRWSRQWEGGFDASSSRVPPPLPRGAIFRRCIAASQEIKLRLKGPSGGVARRTRDSPLGHRGGQNSGQRATVLTPGLMALRRSSTWWILLLASSAERPPLFGSQATRVHQRTPFRSRQPLQFPLALRGEAQKG